MNHVRNPKQTSLSFGPFSGGLVTVTPPELCKKSECAELTNLIIFNNELLRTRDGLSLSFSGVTGSVVHIAEAKVAGTWRTFISSTESGTPNKHRLYYKNGTSVTEVGTYASYSGPIRFVGFNDALIIFDTGVMKQWDGTSLSSLTDDGIGVENFVIANYDADETDGVYDLDTTDFSIVADVPRLAYKFTTPDFSADSTQIQPTVQLRMGKIGNGYGATGSAAVKPVVKIRLLSDPTTIIASKEMMAITAVPLLNNHLNIDEYADFEYKFETSEITGTILPSTEYLLSIEYTEADAGTNYIIVPGNRPTDHSGYYYSTTTSAWSAMEATIAVNLKLGIAPKADHGIVASSRLFCFSASEPTRVYYSGAGNQYDWSSPNYGGYMEIGREVGGIVSFYNSIWVFGTDNDPSLRKLAGNQPSEYTLTDTLQHVGANHATIASTPDDVFFLFGSGVGALSTIQEFGDVRSVGQSDNIENIIRTYYDSNAVCGYDAKNGIYLMKLNDGTTQTLYAVHTKIKNGKYLGGKVYPESPIAKFSLNLPQVSGANQTITAIASIDGETYLGTDKGYVYKFIDTALTDAGNTVTYTMKSSYQSTGFGELTAWQLLINSFSANAGTFDVKFYVNHSTTALFSQTITMPSSLTAAQPDSGTSFVADFNRLELNFNFRSIQMSYDNIVPNGTNHMYLGGAQLMALRTGGL